MGGGLVVLACSPRIVKHQWTVLKVSQRPLDTLQDTLYYVGNRETSDAHCYRDH